MSTSSTISTAPTVNTVEVAANKLTGKFFKEECIAKHGEVFGRIYHFFSFIKRYDIAVFSNKLDALTHLVAKRTLSNSEYNQLGIDSANISRKQQKEEAKEKANLEAAFTNFYAAFKTRCKDLSSEDMAELAQGGKFELQKKVDAIFTSENHSVAEAQARMAPYIQEFEKRAYVDVVNAFASQAAADINMESFAAKSKTLSAVFKSQPKDVEASLRQAALSDKVGNHGKNFMSLQAKFEKTGEGSEFEAFKNGIRALKPGLEKAEARLKELNGDWFQDPKSLLDIAYKKLQGAEADFKVRREEYKKNTGNNIDKIVLEGDILGQCNAVTNSMTQLSPNLNEAAKTYKAAKAEFDQLTKERDTVEKFVTDLKNRLDEKNLDVEAKAKMGNQAAFYKEMQVVVGDNNKQRCFNEMDKLLKRAGVRT